MKNYVKNIVFHLLSLLDGTINLIWSLMGGKVILVDFSSSFLLNCDIIQYDIEIYKRENDKEKHIDSLISDAEASLRENNASPEDINAAVAELNTMRK